MFFFQSKVKDLSKSRVRDDFRVVLLVPILLGEVPFDLNYNYKWYLFIYDAAIYAGILYAAFYSLIDTDNFKGFNKLMVTVNHIQYTLLIVCGVVNMCCSQRLKKQLKFIVRQLEYFDFNLKRVGSTSDVPDERRLRGILYDLISLLVVLVLDLLLAEGVDQLPWIFSTVVYYGMVLKSFMYKRFITNTMFIFKARFEKLTENLKWTLTSEKHGVVEVEMLCYRHSRLVDISNNLNVAFGPQIFFFVSFYFIFTVIFLYILTANIVVLQTSFNNQVETITFIIVIMSWVCMITFHIWHIIHSACDTSNTVNAF